MEKHYRYVFSNQESHTMTPLEAHRYAHKHKIDILHGPNYREGRREKAFDGWGWHDGLMRTFKGPKDYRDYLKANDLIEAGNEKAPLYEDYQPPLWDEALIRKAINEYKMEIGSVLAEALLSGELDWPEG